MKLPSLGKFSLSGLSPFRKEEGFVALDIGSSSIKMVEAAAEKGGYHLLNLGALPLPTTAVQNNMVVEKDAVVSAIRSLIQSSKVTATRVISAVPGRAVIIKKIQLPAQGEEELEANVEFEATNVIPESLENVNLDYQVLSYTDDGSKMEVLLVAVKKEIINSYTQAIQEAGLIPSIMDVDYFAMENMYEANYETKPGESVGLIHVGARYTSINVLRNGISTFTGDLPAGGETFTEALMDELKVSYQQAEGLKVTGQLEHREKVNVKSLLQQACDSLSEDISRTLSLYGAVSTEEGIHNIYLSGGSAKIPGLRELLAEKLGVTVHFSEPFKGFSVGRHIDKDYLANSGGAFAVGAGLAIRRPGDK